MWRVSCLAVGRWSRVVGVRWVLVLAALVSGSSFASDPESTPLIGPWRVELGVAPVSAQVNGLFVDHLGTSGQVAVVLAPHFRVFVAATWNWHAGESRLARELNEKSRVDTFRIDRNDSNGGLLVSMGLVAGTEFVLSRGSVASFHFPHRFELSLAGFAGALSTKAQLKPEADRADGSVSPATFGDTGWRPTIGAGIGLRFEFLERFSIRVDLRESFFSSRVQTVNGCNVDDMRVIDSWFRGLPRSPATLTSACRADTFDGTDPDTGLRRSNDVPLALHLVRNPSSEWASLQALQVSFGVVF